MIEQPSDASANVLSPTFVIDVESDLRLLARIMDLVALQQLPCLAMSATFRADGRALVELTVRKGPRLDTLIQKIATITGVNSVEDVTR